MRTRAKLAGPKKTRVPKFAYHAKASSREIETPLDSHRPFHVVVVSWNSEYFCPAIFKTREGQELWQLMMHHLVLASPVQQSSGRLGAA